MNITNFAATGIKLEHLFWSQSRHTKKKFQIKVTLKIVKKDWRNVPNIPTQVVANLTRCIRNRLTKKWSLAGDYSLIRIPIMDDSNIIGSCDQRCKTRLGHFKSRGQLCSEIFLHFVKVSIRRNFFQFLNFGEISTSLKKYYLDYA